MEGLLNVVLAIFVASGIIAPLQLFKNYGAYRRGIKEAQEALRESEVISEGFKEKNEELKFRLSGLEITDGEARALLKSCDQIISDAHKKAELIHIEAVSVQAQIINAANSTSDFMGLRASVERDSILTEAKAQSSEIIKRAVSSSDFMILNANIERDSILVEARARSSNIIKRALDRAKSAKSSADMFALKLEGQSQELATLEGRLQVEVALHNQAVEAWQVEEALFEERIQRLRNTYRAKKTIYDALSKEVLSLQDSLDVIESGFYESLFNFDESSQYRDKISEIRSRQKELLKNKLAAVCNVNWTLSNSRAKGRLMTNKQIRIALRAFNGESDAAIAKVRWNNIKVMIGRIDKSREVIEKLNSINGITITDEYYSLKMEELRATYEYKCRLKAEREEKSELLRVKKEEEKLREDLKLAEDEQAKYAELLESARLEAAKQTGIEREIYQSKIQELEKRLSQVTEVVERAQSMAEMTKSGWVYVISNVGSFGDGVVKIGLTRRLDPVDRVRELGAASVPFLFDTHAMIFSEDAPALEKALHSRFHHKRVNTVNTRKEFFRVSLDEVELAVQLLAPDSTFFSDIEAQEFKETQVLRNARLISKPLPVEPLFPDEL